MKILNEHPMNLKSLIGGMVIAVAAFFTNLDCLNCHSHLYGVLTPAIHNEMLRIILPGCLCKLN